MQMNRITVVGHLMQNVSVCRVSWIGLVIGCRGLRPGGGCLVQSVDVQLTGVWCRIWLCNWRVF